MKKKFFFAVALYNATEKNLAILRGAGLGVISRFGNQSVKGIEKYFTSKSPVSLDAKGQMNMVAWWH